MRSCSIDLDGKKTRIKIIYNGPVSTIRKTYIEIRNQRKVTALSIRALLILLFEDNFKIIFPFAFSHVERAERKKSNSHI